MHTQASRPAASAQAIEALSKTRRTSRPGTLQPSIEASDRTMTRPSRGLCDPSTAAESHATDGRDAWVRTNVRICSSSMSVTCPHPRDVYAKCARILAASSASVGRLRLSGVRVCRASASVGRPRLSDVRVCRTYASVGRPRLSVICVRADIRVRDTSASAPHLRPWGIRICGASATVWCLHPHHHGCGQEQTRVPSVTHHRRTYACVRYLSLAR